MSINDLRVEELGEIIENNKIPEGGILLENGFPATIEELEKRYEELLMKQNEELSDEYILMDEEEVKEEKKYRFKKIISKVLPAAIVLSSLAIGTTGINNTNIIRKETNYDIVSDDVTDISLETEEIVPIGTSVDLEVSRYDLDNLKIGDSIELPDGISYYESTDHDFGGKNELKHIGDNSLQSKEYLLEGISIQIPTEDGSYRVGQVKWKTGMTLDEVVDDYLLNNGLDENDVNIRLHFSSPISGWVNYNELVTYKDVVTIENEKEIKETKHIDQKVEDFNGTVTFKNNEQEISVKLVDDDNNYLSVGSIVKGSDGKDYKIDTLNTLEVNRVVENTNEVVKDNILVWSLKDISLPASAIIMGSTILGSAALLFKKKKEINDDYEVLDEDESLSLMLDEQRNMRDTLLKIQNTLEQMKETTVKKSSL